MASSSTGTGAALAYNDCHRLFLQHCLAERVFTEPQLSALQRRCALAHFRNNQQEANEFIRNQPLSLFLDLINGKLDPLSLEFRSMPHQGTGQRIWALVNAKGDDEVSKLATEFTPTDLAYVRRVVGLIVTAPNDALSVRSMLAIQAGPNASGGGQLTQKDAQRILDQLVEDGWLEYSESGLYGLAPRMIMELQRYLKDEFPDIGAEDDNDDDEESEDYEDESGEGRRSRSKSKALSRPRRAGLPICIACSEVTTYGQKCSNPLCMTYLHHFCAARYLNARVASAQVNSTGGATCPQCTADWSIQSTFGFKPAPPATAAANEGGVASVGAAAIVVDSARDRRNPRADASAVPDDDQPASMQRRTRRRL